MSALIEKNLITVSAARSGRKRPAFNGVTVHETANYRSGANARGHQSYMAGNGKNKQVSAHYYVDDVRAVQLIPEEEVAWHAGDGVKPGGGNLTTVAIEICEDWGFLPLEYAGMQAGVPSEAAVQQEEKNKAMLRFSVAIDNAAQLAADILYRNGKETAEGWLWQHNHWSGKDCPHNIRKDRPIGWGTFKGKVQARLDALKQGKQAEIEALPPAEAPEKIVYKVQVGAFSKPENAQRLLESLRAKGFEGVLLKEER